jgi:hypothetical protein
MWLMLRKDALLPRGTPVLHLNYWDRVILASGRPAYRR